MKPLETLKTQLKIQNKTVLIDKKDTTKDKKKKIRNEKEQKVEHKKILCSKRR